jgi:glutamate/tyrosine decarboxylase-like PLP-dependent enzyme
MLPPIPLFDVIAGMTLFNLYTAESWWDLTGGNICLFERQIVSLLGQLVGWSDAEGFVVTGGKQSLLYAIKSGMSRANNRGKIAIDDLVVVSSQLAHFSIEHVCNYLGIRPSNSLRVATVPSGEISSAELEEVLCNAILSGKRIAAIIALGGATINLIPDSVQAIRQVVDNVVSLHHLDYSPYIHMDSVLSWPWLAFSAAEDNSWKERTSSRVIEKIDHVLSKLRETKHADSFAVDFHKLGFCPYPAGVFIAKEAESLSALPLDGQYPSKDVSFGEAEMFRSTLENSRSGVPVAAIWIALRRMGMEGFKNFVLYQLNVCEEFKKILRLEYGQDFEVINEHSNNCEVILKPHFGDRLSWDEIEDASEDVRQEYTQACYRFLDFVWYGNLDSHPYEVPVIGFVKSYARGESQKHLPAFMIYPTSLHYNEENIRKMIDSIAGLKRTFDTIAGQADSTLKIIVTTPPR